MQLVTAANFIFVKSSIERLLYKISGSKISAVNEQLRKRFVGREVDSLSCTRLNRNLISVRITIGRAVTVFQVDISKGG